MELLPADLHAWQVIWDYSREYFVPRFPEEPDAFIFGEGSSLKQSEPPAKKDGLLSLWSNFSCVCKRSISKGRLWACTGSNVCKKTHPWDEASSGKTAQEHGRKWSEGCRQQRPRSQGCRESNITWPSKCPYRGRAQQKAPEAWEIYSMSRYAGRKPGMQLAEGKSKAKAPALEKLSNEMG